MTKEGFEFTGDSHSQNSEETGGKRDLFQRMFDERGSQYDWFKTADGDGNGVLSQSEMQAGSGNYDLTNSEREFLAAAVEHYELASEMAGPSEKQGVSREDISAIRLLQEARTDAYLNTDETREVVLQNFERLDLNNNGELSRKEIRSALTQLPKETEYSQGAKDALRAVKNLQGILEARDVMRNSVRFNQESDGITKAGVEALRASEVESWKQQSVIAERIEDDHSGLKWRDLAFTVGGGIVGYFLKGEKGMTSGGLLGFGISRKIDNYERPYYVATDAMNIYKGYRDAGMESMLAKFDAAETVPESPSSQAPAARSESLSIEEPAAESELSVTDAPPAHLEPRNIPNDAFDFNLPPAPEGKTTANRQPAGDLFLDKSKSLQKRNKETGLFDF
jgi:hypothetical protein